MNFYRMLIIGAVKERKENKEECKKISHLPEVIVGVGRREGPPRAAEEAPVTSPEKAAETSAIQHPVGGCRGAVAGTSGRR
jgi:hypothetical protein